MLYSEQRNNFDRKHTTAEYHYHQAPRLLCTGPVAMVHMSPEKYISLPDPFNLPIYIVISSPKVYIVCLVADYYALFGPRWDMQLFTKGVMQMMHMETNMYNWGSC